MQIDNSSGFPTIDSLSFEQAMAELEGIVKKLESGQVSLEESIEFFTKGNALKSHCGKKLKEARMKVEMIVKGESGAVSLNEFSA